MVDSHSFLIEWMITFLKNKDMIRKEITGVDTNKAGFDFVVQRKTTAKNGIVVMKLDEMVLQKINKENRYLIVTLNNRENVSFLVAHWKAFVAVPFLQLFFVNPLASTGKVWIISPAVHERVCDHASLETGIRSMAELVEPIGRETFETKLQQIE